MTYPRLLVLLCLLVAACGTPGQDLVIDVEPSPVLPASYPVAEEVGRLLSADSATSEAAETRLIALDGERRDRLLAYASTIPTERDLRWLHVLDEHHALPDLTADERLDFLLWKAARPERTQAMKAQSQLMDMAREDPAPLIARIQAGAAGSDVLAVVLGLANTRAAVPALLARYRAARDARERAAPAEALGMLWDGGRGPRVHAARSEIARDADRIETWYREQTEGGRDATARPPEGAPR